jgi:hypothetical protein
MTTKYAFELELEKIAERFYINSATNRVNARKGSSADNEDYFRWVASDLRERLSCQQLVLNSGVCPDSGIFGDFHYKTEDLINWEEVRSGSSVALELLVPGDQKRYIEIKKDGLSLPDKITAKSKIVLTLNDLDYFGEFFGVEYKASTNAIERSIAVASFNSSCPSKTKTIEITSARLIHSLPTSKRDSFGDGFKIVPITLKVKISLYYMIVNDEVANNKSKIRHIFITSGDFFSGDTSEEVAKVLSEEKKPIDFGIKASLNKVGLRYRPFFESRKIQADGYGIYTNWEPKIPAEAKEGAERALLLQEVLHVQQKLIDNDTGQEIPLSPTPDKEPGRLIHLTLRESRIKLRAA